MIMTFAQQQELKPISANNEYKWDQIGIEVYETKLVPLFGESFMLDIEENLENPDYAPLLDGCNYEIKGNKKRHGGIRKTLAYLIYAQYIQESGLEDTFTGLIRQARNETDPANSGDIGRAVKFAYQNASINTEGVKTWLNHVNSFAKWELSNKAYKPLSKSQFFGIKKK